MTDTMNNVTISHLQQAHGSAKETEQAVQIGKKRNWNSQYATNTCHDVTSAQFQHVPEAGDKESLQVFGETANVLDCAAGVIHEARLESGSNKAVPFTEQDYTCTELPSEAACEGGCGCHPMCPEGQQAHCHNYEHFLPCPQPTVLDVACNSNVWCNRQQSYMLKASVSSEDTPMTWTEDHSTPSSGPLTDDYCCNSYNDESDQDNVFTSQDIATRGSTAVMSHYGPLGGTMCCHGAYEDLHGENSTEDCSEHSSNNTTQVLRHLDDILRNKVNLELDECRRSVHGILDKNLGHVQHLLRLSHDSPDVQDFEMNTQSMTGVEDAEYRNSFDASYDISPGTLEDEEVEKMKCMVQLLTQASVISCSLAKKDFPL